jgi:3'-phosphoadenosine 5'-phosphosulfate sulfotransferase (PAPS reductase)/FAD synthetase
MNLHNYDIIIINSSAGKDSLCAIWEVCRIAKEQGYPMENICVSHQDLGKMEWAKTKELAEQQAELFGLPIYYSKRRNKDGYEETLLEYVIRRGKWPSKKQRWCTSDFKRGPGARIITALTKGKKNCNVLYVFGFRSDESPERSKKQVLKQNKRQSTLTRKVYEWLPIHHWSTERVWNVIRENHLPYHFAYDLGMPRLSCVFCIFRKDFSLQSVKEAIENNYQPESVKDWVM